MSHRLSFRLALLLATASLVVKLMLAWNTHGTNDIDMWESSASIAQGADSSELYRQRVTVLHDGQPYYEETFNHPPMMIHLLRVVANLAEAWGITFPQAFRTLMSLADSGVFLLTAWLLRSGMMNLWLVAFCPAAIMIAGFHGNSDPLMILFLLAAAASSDRGGSPWLTGLCFALAINVKLLPVFLLPALWFSFPDWRARLQCFGTIAVTSLAWWLPYLRADPTVVIDNTLGYHSLTGIWGFGYLLRGTIAFMPYSTYGKYALLMLLTWLAWRMHGPGIKITLFEQFGVTLFLFLFLSPGFGVQYLYWITPWVDLLNWRLHLLPWLATGAFLFAVYTYWCSGLPWAFADSIRMGQWYGVTQGLQLLAWLSTGAVVMSYYRLHRS